MHINLIIYGKWNSVGVGCSRRNGWCQILDGDTIVAGGLKAKLCTSSGHVIYQNKPHFRALRPLATEKIDVTKLKESVFVSEDV